MGDKFAKKHSFAIILIVFFFVILMDSLECIEVAIHRSDYTKITGTIEEKYSERYRVRTRRGRRWRTKTRITVSFEYDGEIYYAKGLRTYPWEQRGEKVKFYVDSEGNAIRGTFALSSGTISMCFMMILYLLKILRNGGITIPRPAMPRGTVIDDYDYLSYNSDMSNYSTNLQPGLEPEPEFKSGLEPESEFKSEPEPKPASQEVPIIEIPEEYL